MNHLLTPRIHRALFIFLIPGILSLGVCQTALAAKEVVAKAGPITHKIMGLAVVPEIPAKWTIVKFKRIAKSKPAPAGHVYYVLRGSATNNSDKSRSITGITYTIMDSAGNRYKPDVKTAIYQPKSTSISHIEVPSGQTRQWLAFFPVPVMARGVRLRANDLTFGSKQYGYFRLPDPVKSVSKKAPAANKNNKPTTVTVSPAKKQKSTPVAGMEYKKVEKFGLEILAPANATVKDNRKVVGVWSNNPVCTVLLSEEEKSGQGTGRLTYERLMSQIQKGLRGGNLKKITHNEKSNNGWAITYTTKDRIHPEKTKYGVHVTLAAGAKRYHCSRAGVRDPKAAECALRSCQSIRVSK